ncbi:MAG: hypothetical protein CL674_09220 [Bdellovibrionaceae bacterium]|nr:hypothetical protein [Pseudobdellovibrionaceae bacterium]|tara:strand:+ start:60396 stop:61055 length:660 start_codon:yes stop_codon:yes gene_type:complete
MNYSGIEILFPSFLITCCLSSYEYFRLQQYISENRVFRLAPFIAYLLLAASCILFSSKFIAWLLIANFLHSIKSNGLVQGASDFLLHFMGILLSLFCFGLIEEEQVIRSASNFLGVFYFISGIDKIKNLKHWKAKSLWAFEKHYSITLLKTEKTKKLMLFLMLAFELGFLILMQIKESLLALIAIGILFHLLIAYFLGLTRFLKHFLLYYIALYFFISI